MTTLGLRIRNRFRHVRQQPERGSLPMAVLVMLVGIGLSATFAPMAINQRKSTTFDMARVHALNAAQAGMDVMVGKIRSATGSQGGETDVPTEPNTAAIETGGPSNPGGSVWMLILALGVLLGSVVILTPAPSKTKR